MINGAVFLMLFVRIKLEWQFGKKGPEIEQESMN